MKQNKIDGEDFTLLRAGISDEANLLAEDELSELFGGYTNCPNGYCNKNYENGAIKCGKKWCNSNYADD